MGDIGGWFPFIRYLQKHSRPCRMGYMVVSATSHVKKLHVPVSPKNPSLDPAALNFDLFNDPCENGDYLTKQIITYIGNKRSLLNFITKGIHIVQKRLQKDKLDIFDVFTGSGIVARHCKQFSHLLMVNDLEKYAAITGECYLSNKDELNMPLLQDMYHGLLSDAANKPLREGIIAQLYSPKNDNNIQKDERVFYTRRNAMYIDTMRNLIDTVPAQYQKYFLAPLIAEASIHANTSGVFKGFHKNKETGIGQFGGSNSDALLRIKGNITLPFPVFSSFNCAYQVYNGDSNVIIKEAPEVDLAYLDPPYNQHPYGSNYFMLSLIFENKHPESVSKISGIPDNWNRSAYNKKQCAYQTFADLVAAIKAKFVLISFNSEGFVSLEEMKAMLKKMGKVQVLETTYNTFRGCRNLSRLAEQGARDIHITEYLYLLEK
ncbi:MAG: DNA adenine methylase [Spirochaetaceae bacterium]|jgi:adenine-specific DNA-methyltransferase|nr:DNA adenine methylase [Spirochaetaceae bacterium]